MDLLDIKMSYVEEIGKVKTEINYNELIIDKEKLDKEIKKFQKIIFTKCLVDKEKEV